MKKSILGVIIAVVSLGLIGLLVFGGEEDAPQQQTQASQNEPSSDEIRNSSTSQPTEADTNTSPRETSSVEISNFAYSPPNIIVKKGSSVTWTNRDSTSHDVTPDNPSVEFTASNLLGKDQSYSVTFNTPGTYTYFCSPHSFMKGSVTVTD